MQGPLLVLHGIGDCHESAMPCVLKLCFLGMSGRVTESCCKQM